MKLSKYKKYTGYYRFYFNSQGLITVSSLSKKHLFKFAKLRTGASVSAFSRWPEANNPCPISEKLQAAVIK